jgi:hypothetical protein
MVQLVKKYNILMLRLTSLVWIARLLTCQCLTSFLPEISLISSLSIENNIIDIAASSLVKENINTVGNPTFSLGQIVGGSAFMRGLVSGAVSRASKEILLHPFDTIRARQQVHC